MNLFDFVWRHNWKIGRYIIPWFQLLLVLLYCYIVPWFHLAGNYHTILKLIVTTGHHLAATITAPFATITTTTTAPRTTIATTTTGTTTMVDDIARLVPSISRSTHALYYYYYCSTTTTTTGRHTHYRSSILYLPLLCSELLLHI